MNDFNSLNDIFSGLQKVYKKRTNDHDTFVKENWLNIVGDFVYKYCRPDRVVKGILYVKTVSSSWMSEISFMKEEIMNSCNKHIGSEAIKEVKVFVGDGKLEQVKKIIEHKLEIKKDYKLDEQLSGVDKEKILESTSHIEDDELRESLQKLLMNSRIQEKSLLKQGWKKCLKCKALFNSKDIICLVCRSGLSKK
ncbi:MAG: DUF721 domain-containing protein [Candidatus Sericytochromatia bacterium]